MRKYVFILLLFNAAITVHCQDTQQYRREAESCFKKGDYECAKKRYTAWQEISGQNADSEIRKAENCIRIKKSADAYYQNKQYENACAEYKSLIALNPDDVNAEQQINRCCFVEPPKPPEIDPLQTGKKYYQNKNYYEAVRWFRKSAEQGNPIGQNNLGLMYENGYGVKKDYSEAVKWYKRSAEQGYAIGQYNLGLMYEYGYGVDKNHNEAVKWLNESAKQGNQEAIAILENNEY